MFGLLKWVYFYFAATELIKEKTAPVYPRSTYFDWDEYNADIAKGMTTVEQNKKHKRGGYLKTR